MATLSKTCTVTLSDDHGHATQFSRERCRGGTKMSAKLDGLRNVMDREADNPSTVVGMLTDGDNLTVTVTQP